MNKKENKDGEIREMDFKSKISIWFDQLKIKLRGKNWTPECKSHEFLCIVCGKVHRNCIAFDKENMPKEMWKKKKPSNKMYTLHFCSDEHMKYYSQYEKIDLYDLSKVKEHLDTGFWREMWIRYYEWKIGLRKNIQTELTGGKK